jgi:hypothetical protein
VPVLANSNSCTMDFSSVDIQFLIYWKSDAVLANLQNVSFLARHHANAINFTEAIPNFLESKHLPSLIVPMFVLIYSTQLLFSSLSLYPLIMDAHAWIPLGLLLACCEQKLSFPGTWGIFLGFGKR